MVGEGCRPVAIEVGLELALVLVGVVNCGFELRQGVSHNLDLTRELAQAKRIGDIQVALQLLVLSLVGVVNVCEPVRVARVDGD